MRFRAEAKGVWLRALAPMLLAVLVAWLPGRMVAQSTTAAGPANSASQNPAPQTQPVPPVAQAAPPGPVQPPAMASRSKLPAASGYDEVHIRPMVKTEDPAKLDPDSPAAAVESMNPALRTHTQPIEVDVDLVLVPVNVTDPYDRPVLGLSKDNFVVLDNGKPQKIEDFSCDDAPVSIGIIFDMSGSMSNKMEEARAAVSEFLKSSNPEDEFFLIAFNDRPRLLSDFTTSIDQVQESLMYAVPKGRTALLDAIYLGIAKMRQARYRREALLIISDGGDNHSRYTEKEIRSLVQEADVQIYAIGIFDAMPRTEEERYGPELLFDVTEVTGGQTYAVDNLKQLSDVAGAIGVELRNEYVLGYRPSPAAHDGKWRKVRVKLRAPKGLPSLTVYAKMGYYAPEE